ncbi:MAG: hypothetical protein KDC73_13695 [Ignavibacteriae bacterium]|nr:hypothetical protein [Ignavibacteriota bacterium]MCB9244707.1 hypothetical protein [Ignavibacteriales bacterium]
MGIFKSIFGGIHKAFNNGTDVLTPVEGMEFEDWAKANARLASGVKTEDLVKDLAMDVPKWDRINTEWLTRMSNDKTYTLSMRYAKHFNSNASGNLPNKISEDTYPFEKYVQVIAAMDILCQKGRDAQDVLKDFGLTTSDYSNLSSFWTKKIMLSPLGLGMKFQEFLMKYREQYINETGGNSHDDLEF